MYRLTHAVCVETEPSGRSVVGISSLDVDSELCADLDDPGSCCPPEFDWVGFDEHLGALCLEKAP